MKQESPLRKKQNYVQTSKVDFTQIYTHINKPTPAQLDARRRETDKCDCADPSQCWKQCGEFGHSDLHVIGWDKGVDDYSGVVMVEAPKEKESNPIREVAQAFVGGLGLGVAVVAVIFGLVGANPLPYALGAVVCLLGYLYLDSE